MKPLIPQDTAELYNLTQDPQENINVAEQAEYKNVRR